VNIREWTPGVTPTILLFSYLRLPSPSFYADTGRHIAHPVMHDEDDVAERGGGEEAKGRPWHQMKPR
jgi:hypothetical protein